MNSDFTISFHRERSVYASFGPPKYFGYLATPFSGPTNFSYPLGPGANSFGPAGSGTYTVKFPPGRCPRATTRGHRASA
jgi:hypothetical protein